MSKDTKNKGNLTGSVRIRITGAGVMHARASDILSTDKAQKQIKALASLKKKKLIPAA